MRNFIITSIILISIISCSLKTDDRGYSVKVGETAPKIDLESIRW